ncbi:hypothetical protein L3X38_025134 [Prunus dulcis]|uniref:Uncharacterized protein n=1 Tax=Prunus dulcis TaxID=3755 RepID=A0AAD4Z720_PRUDU|nr:hypothetical protein L3X38_025134 [Prunus dulcis]
MPPAPAKKDMMIVATDYFTKWIEAAAISSTKEADVKRFYLEEHHLSILLLVVNSHRQWDTVRRQSTGKTPFSLAYGTEAIIPPHITVPSKSIEVGSLDQNCKQMKVNLNLLEEELDKAIVRVAAY